jgi:hypothetical protein
MSRPRSVTAVITIHAVATMALIGLCVYLLWLTHSPEILSDKDAASAIQGLKIGALILGIPAALWIPGIYAMWKRRRWGWWLTLITGLGTASVFVYSMIDDGWKAVDPEDASANAAFAILPILLLLPKVRRYYRHSKSNPSPAMGNVPEITSTTS